MFNNDPNNIFSTTSGQVLIEIIVWIALAFFIIEIFFFFWKDKLLSAITSSKNFQVPLSAFLGIIPGCGGTFFLIPLYKQRLISFGSMSAALISTIGEVSFILIAVNPYSFLLITVILIITGIITGYILDGFKIWANEPISIIEASNKDNLHNHDHFHQLNLDSYNPDNYLWNNKIRLNHKNQKYHWFNLMDKYILPILLYLIILILLPLTIINSFTPGKIDSNDQINSYYNFGIYLSSLVIILVIAYKIFRDLYLKFNPELKDEHDHHNIDDDHIQSKSKEFFDELHHLFITLLFLITWIFISFLAINYLLAIANNNINHVWNFNDNYGIGFLILLIAIMIGFIPICAPQIVFSTLFLSNVVTFSALVGNNISQDAHVGLPMISMDKKSYARLKIVNASAAIIVGFIFLNIETFTNLNTWITSFN